MSKAKGSPSSTANPKARALLDAHVAFLVERLTDAPLRDWIEREVDALRLDAAKLRLKDAVTPALIKQTVQVFAVQLDLRGGIPELVSGVARAVYEDEIHSHTRLGDLVSEPQFRQWLDKALELKALREKLVRGALANPVFADFASDLITHGIRDYLSENAVTRGIPGASSMLKLGKAVMARATPRLEGAVEEGLRKYVSRSVEATAKKSAELLLSRLDDATLRRLSLDIWHSLKKQPLAALRENIQASDVDDIVAMTYEYWGELRRTRFYSAVIHAGIDAFFASYGELTLAELLDDLGVTRELMIGEAMRYAPPVLKAVKKKKLLEPTLRRLLEPFYQSEAATRLLSAGE